MKTIVAFILGATLTGITSGVIASDIDTFNQQNGYWGTPCPTTYGVEKPCDESVLTYMEENMLYN